MYRIFVFFVFQSDFSRSSVCFFSSTLVHPNECHISSLYFLRRHLEPRLDIEKKRGLLDEKTMTDSKKLHEPQQTKTLACSDKSRNEIINFTLMLSFVIQFFGDTHR